MKIAIGNDHCGVQIKEQIINHFKNFDFINVGTDDEVSVDYPIYAFKVGELVSNHQADVGILICKTGIGMSIACNKVKNIRCAKVDNVLEASLTRAHNDANVLALSAVMDFDKIIEIIDTFLNEPFSNDERHKRRVDMISRYENDC